jgi:hypothetical protein
MVDQELPVMIGLREDLNLWSDGSTVDFTAYDYG